MLTIDSLTYRYGRRTALIDVTLEAPAGRVISLVGRNGSGKSTLLRLIAGLIHPSAGLIHWGGCEPARMAAIGRARLVTFVSQRPTLSIDLAVDEAIALGRYAMQRGAESTQRIESAIDEMGLGPFRRRSFHELSAGEQQRCVVARALAQHEPQGLFLLDEPFSNLDPGETARVAQALRQRADRGGLVLVALHDLALADQIADEIWWLEQGRLIGSGAPAVVLTEERLQSIFGCQFIRGPQGLTHCAVQR